MKLKELIRRYREQRVERRRSSLLPATHAGQEGTFSARAPAIRPGAGPAGTPGRIGRRVIKPQDSSNPFPGVNVK